MSRFVIWVLVVVGLVAVIVTSSMATMCLAPAEITSEDYCILAEPDPPVARRFHRIDAALSERYGSSFAELGIRKVEVRTPGSRHRPDAYIIKTYLPDTSFDYAASMPDVVPFSIEIDDSGRVRTALELEDEQEVVVPEPTLANAADIIAYQSVQAALRVVRSEGRVFVK